MEGIIIYEFIHLFLITCIHSVYTIGYVMNTNDIIKTHWLKEYEKYIYSLLSHRKAPQDYTYRCLDQKL